MLKIYHAPLTRSLRVIWLCEELGLDLEVERISFDPAYRFSEEWLAKNPVGKVPVLEDGDLMMFESGAMLQYLLDRYGEGQLQPKPGTTAHAEYLQWSWFAESTFCRPVGEIVNHARNFNPVIDDVVAEMTGRSDQCLSAVNDALADREYICGEFTAADIMLGYCFVLAERFTSLLDKDYPHAKRYWQTLMARPSASVILKEAHQ